MQKDQPLEGIVPNSKFEEKYVEADGFRIRFKEAGQGEPLVCFHGAGGMKIYGSHERLAERYRVILFEVPGFGESPVNERSQSMQELARTMAQAAANLGIECFNLMGNSFGGKLALWLAAQFPERVQALVLVAPAAIRREGDVPPQALSTDELMARLYAKPERQEPLPPSDSPIVTKQRALVRRVMGPARDAELEDLMPGLEIPVLVLFGTLDRMTPPELGRKYCEMLPNCSFILVYDAAHEVDADRPEAFASLLDDFLHRHEGFLVKMGNSLINP